jgi:CelD/BcsL family acetyltransferase involved in cellulose biosynthesis
MEYQLIQTAGEWEELKPGWNALLETSTSHVPFLRYEYLRTWWETRGGGEWPDPHLAIVAARQAGQLVGIAPMFQARNPQGQPALLLLGSIEISDFLDVISPESTLLDFLVGLLPFLKGANLPEWQVLDWYNILDSSTTLPALEEAAQKLGWSFTSERLQHSPYIPLPGDWETYLSGIDKKQRHEIRRKLRRAEGGETPTRWYISDGKNLDQEIQAFFDLMANDPEKAEFLTPLMRQQMTDTIHCAFDEGCLQLSFLDISDQKAAAYLSFDYLDRIWVYNSGLDRRFMEVSPGWVLLAYLLRWANENNRTEFDFMRGNEDYKYRFGAVDRFVLRAVVKP